ncbi:UNVERIFIED_CONTAM: hypothetical protein Slati_2662200 [Sesamum latifolium]|uniref:Uncharacterized protein n=1 Tax=Sesamum latifolium TaxID=2727402 RepID=A0AAW2VUC5_9LAMI
MMWSSSTRLHGSRNVNTNSQTLLNSHELKSARDVNIFWLKEFSIEFYSAKLELLHQSDMEVHINAESKGTQGEDGDVFLGCKVIHEDPKEFVGLVSSETDDQYCLSIYVFFQYGQLGIGSIRVVLDDVHKGTRSSTPKSCDISCSFYG